METGEEWGWTRGTDSWLPEYYEKDSTLSSFSFRGQKEPRSKCQSQEMMSLGCSLALPPAHAVWRHRWCHDQCGALLFSESILTWDWLLSSGPLWSLRSQEVPSPHPPYPGALSELWIWILHYITTVLMDMKNLSSRARPWGQSTGGPPSRDSDVISNGYNPGTRAFKNSPGDCDVFPRVRTTVRFTWVSHRHMNTDQTASHSFITKKKALEEIPLLFQSSSINIIHITRSGVIL